MKTSQLSQIVSQYVEQLKEDSLTSYIQKEVIALLNHALHMSQSEVREDKEAIHAIRVILKQLRAYWRLIQFVVTDSVFQTADQRIRLILKLLAGQRDRQMLSESLAMIASQLKRRDKVVAERVNVQLNPALEESPPALKINWIDVTSTLRIELSTWQSLAYTPDKNNAIQKGLQRTLIKGRLWAEQATLDTADMSQRHKWRRWVKYQYYQLKLLKQFGLKGQQAKLVWLKELEDGLGKEHDFEVLQCNLEQQALAPSANRESLKRIMKVNRKQIKQIKKHINLLIQMNGKDYL